MITRLREAPSQPPGHDRRGLKRLVSESGAIPVLVTTRDGRVHHASAGDINAAGAMLLGALPIAVGEHVHLRLHLDSSAAPYATDAVVTHRTRAAAGARFLVRSAANPGAMDPKTIMKINRLAPIGAVSRNVDSGPRDLNRRLPVPEA